MKVDIGAFDVAVRVATQVEWLEPSDDIAILNLRLQFEKNLELLAANYQKFFSASLAKAIKQDKMYFQTPDLNMEGMNSDQLDELKDIS